MFYNISTTDGTIISQNSTAQTFPDGTCISAELDYVTATTEPVLDEQGLPTGQVTMVFEPAQLTPEQLADIINAHVNKQATDVLSNYAWVAVAYIQQVLINGMAQSDWVALHATDLATVAAAVARLFPHTSMSKA